MTSTYSEKEWQFRRCPGYISDEQINQTALELGVPETIVRILAIRGVSDPKTINTFLTPVLAQLPRPHLMKGMDEAVAILLDAIKFQKPVTVFGDFDADGDVDGSHLATFAANFGRRDGCTCP